MSAVDDYKMALNILARVGINSPDFVKEYAKSKAQLHAIESYNQMNSQNIAPVMPNQSPTAPISAPVDTTIPLGANPAQSTQNTPSTPEGGLGLNLPQ
jgi:hypothetical protein